MAGERLEPLNTNKMTTDTSIIRIMQRFITFIYSSASEITGPTELISL